MFGILVCNLSWGMLQGGLSGGPIAPLLLVWLLYRGDTQLIAQEAHKCASGCTNVK